MLHENDLQVFDLVLKRLSYKNTSRKKKPDSGPTWTELQNYTADLYGAAPNVHDKTLDNKQGSRK